MSTQQKQNELTAEQRQQFHDDGFLFVQNVLPNAALQPLIDELTEQVDNGTRAAVTHGILDPSDTYDNAPFETRLGRYPVPVPIRTGFGATISATKRSAPLGCSR